MDSSINRPIKIVFVCEGNICRSPMAEFIFKDMANKAGLSDRFEVTSRGTSYSTVGQDIYPKAKEELIKNGIPFIRREATLITKKDYNEADYVIGMDKANLIAIKRIIYLKDNLKLHRLYDFSNVQKDVVDPLNTRDFESVYQDLNNGCYFFGKIFKLD